MEEKRGLTGNALKLIAAIAMSFSALPVKPLFSSIFPLLR